MIQFNAYVELYKGHIFLGDETHCQSLSAFIAICGNELQDFLLMPLPAHSSRPMFLLMLSAVIRLVRAIVHMFQCLASLDSKYKKAIC